MMNKKASDQDPFGLLDTIPTTLPNSYLVDSKDAKSKIILRMEGGPLSSLDVVRKAAGDNTLTFHTGQDFNGNSTNWCIVSGTIRQRMIASSLSVDASTNTTTRGGKLTTWEGKHKTLVNAGVNSMCVPT